ncbi:aldehyde dehydrogenase family protein [Phenylobacterium sp. LjRoot219]|uniref:aldehyde dehydrogenase family protein n=1 Tax=Phenylobacterium sp. LjRoot219 TaxID=3342283 RepID=UPI003ECDEF6F
MTIHTPQSQLTAAGRGRLYIGGEAVAGEGETFAVINPGTEEVIAEVAGASAGQVEAAIGAARRAYDSGVWCDLPAAERAQALRRLMAALAAQRDRLVELSVREAGCPVSSGSMAAQVHAPLQHGLDTIELFLQLPEFEENPLPFEQRLTPRGGAVQSLRRHLPVGVVAAISAYNFPFYTNLWKVLPALITGNTVILRPNPLTPLAALVFGEAAEAAGLPPGVLNVIAEQGAGGAVALSTHADVDMVAFTGSTGVGKQVMVQAAPTMKRLQLELGGKSAQIYMPDSVAQAGMAAAMVAMGHAGQGCAHGTRVFVPEADKAQALEAMAAPLAKVKIGDPADPQTQMGPVISAAQRDRCERYVALAVEAGAKVVYGGKRPEGLAKGFFFEPTILDTPDNKNPAAQEEIFGPVVSVIGYRDLDHLVEMANDSPYGLSGYVTGKDIKQAIGVASKIRTGTVNVNGGLLSAYASSGGWKQSGVGRERGVEGLRVYQQIQAMNIQGA